MLSLVLLATLRFGNTRDICSPAYTISTTNAETRHTKTIMRTACLPKRSAALRIFHKLEYFTALCSTCKMDLSHGSKPLWRITDPPTCRPRDQPLYPLSDDILCSEIHVIDRTAAIKNAQETCPQWHDLSEDKDFLLEGKLLTARRAGCGDFRTRQNVGPDGGWLKSVCHDTYANQVVMGPKGQVCAPRHQAFLNQTRRGTGTDNAVLNSLTRDME